MGDSVKYQIEKAEAALRSALELGAIDEDPYTLHSIVESLQKLSFIIAMKTAKDTAEKYEIKFNDPLM